MLNITIMTANNAYPIELMHSVAYRICVIVVDNVPFDGHFVKMLKLFSNNDKGYMLKYDTIKIKKKKWKH